MIQFDFKTHVYSTDVKLSRVRTYTPLSNDVISIIDSSYLIENNSILKSIEDVEAYPNINWTLDFQNVFGEVLLSDEVGFDFNTYAEHPLWYKTSLSRAYYNDTETMQSVIKVIDLTEEKIIRGLISQNSKIIVNDSVIVEVTPTGETYTNTLTSDEYVVDFGKGTVHLNIDDINGITSGTFTVKYRTISVNINLEEDKSKYRFAVDKLDDYLFALYIYHSINKSYTINYPIKVGSDILQREEQTISTYLYAEIEYNRLLKKELRSKYFSRIDDTIYIKKNNPLERFFIRPKYVSNSEIYLKKPNLKEPRDYWYMMIKAGVFKENGLTYRIDTTDQYRTVYENPIILGEDKIKLKYSALFVHTDNGYSGIDIYERNNKIEIDKIDSDKQTITLKRNISVRSTLEVKYSTINNDYIYYTSLNTRSTHNNTINAQEQVIIFLIMPEEELDLNKPNIHLYPIDRFVDGKTINYNAEEIYNIGTNGETIYNNVESIRNAVLPGYGYDPGDLPIHPLPLGAIVIDNKYKPSVSKIDDIRSRGGGVHPSVHEEDYNYDNVLYDQFDIGRWDGEHLDLGGVLIFKIPLEILWDLSSIMYNYDPEVVIIEDIESKSLLADKKAEEYLKTVIEKRRPYGKLFYIEYV